ncbi:capsular polysaccharide export protein, LipB/KpsS family [Gelidibacter maritimus]|uniref:Capsule polysaccharide biosynthesis protein n=1 Tax=Gelidibacter maritimus TaxID=2761487 RepID=A0A7W2R2L8_9FLAO|nr:hypothetical protein [Gelidibacter maritimus]MBA6151932.1 hypothetical protein [Gelidibacter maritimus]
MKLLFIENRHKTFLFELITNQLGKNGHEIHWLIQNKQFIPSGNAKKYIIDYPSTEINGYKKDQAIEDIIKSDRQFNHFNKQDTSYFYYYNDKIERYLKELKPDFVFGESTAFHELLTINNCKKQQILYLNPSTCRYPTGRFSFYKYNTLEPYLGSMEVLSDKDANAIIDQIVNRKTTPDYMKPSPASKRTIIKDKAIKIYSYAKGEKYNTPSPLTKYRLEKEKENNIKLWDAFAKDKIDVENKTILLYPLQMQPEANIDVWGHEHRNQLQLIKSISNLIPKNVVLVVKPNPKSKYELSRDLVDYVQNSSNIIALQHKVKMDEVFPHVDLVVTVTGTIAIECILSNKPVVTMTKTINNCAKSCIYIKNITTELQKIIDTVNNNTFHRNTNQEKINFINALNATSYKGVISDPFSDKNCISANNIELVTSAFINVIEKQHGQKNI